MLILAGLAVLWIVLNVWAGDAPVDGVAAAAPPDSATEDGGADSGGGDDGGLLVGLLEFLAGLFV